MAAPKTTPSSKQETGYGCFTRLCWMLFGNVALLFSAVAISKHHDGFLSRADLIFWIVVALLVAIRHYDITKMDGLTASEKPATIAHWRRYVLYLSVFSVLLWTAAHAIARFS